MIRAAILAACLAGPAAAHDMTCFATGFDDFLADEAHEAKTWEGFTGKALVQVWRAADGTTWTLVLALPDGRLCMMASGSMWQDVPLPVAGVDG